MIFEMIIEKEEIKSDYCIECGGSIIYIPEIGETVCYQCGLVINERGLDLTHSDKRIYDEQEHMNKKQYGSLITPLTPTIGLHTIMLTEEITNPDFKRVAKWNTRLSWNEQNILIASTELRRISSNLNLPGYVKVSAIKIYKKIYKMNILKGRSINAMVAACIYYSCRKWRVNRMFIEILEEVNEFQKEIKLNSKLKNIIGVEDEITVKELLIKNIIKGAKKKVRQVNEIVEDFFIYPCLKSKNVKVLEIPLNTFIFEILAEYNSLEDVFEKEKNDMDEFIRGITQIYNQKIKQYILSQIKDKIEVLFITRIGSLFPFYRTSDIVDKLLNFIEIPSVFFYPGIYIKDYATDEEEILFFGKYSSDSTYRTYPIG